jgi:deoxyribonuclease V
MEEVEEAGLQMPCSFPYVPGLLSFREGPAVVEAFRRLGTRPDAVIFDGQGFAHPRRIGLASHMGLWLGLPTVGCAKSRLVGEHDEPGREKGERVPLHDEGEQIGVVLRSRTDVRPVFVSPGHLADLDTSTDLVLRCCLRYRLPEPTRRAHLAVGRLKKRRLEAP